MDNKAEIKIELPEIINTTLNKPANTLGEKLSDLLEIIFGGITYKKKELTYKRDLHFQMFKETLTKKVEAIPEEKRVEPKESIIGPVLEAAKYRIDSDELRDMFAELIASSLNEDKQEWIHPAFIDILQNISPNDAKTLLQLKAWKDTHLVPVISIGEKVMSIPNNLNHYCFLVEEYGIDQANIILFSLIRNGLIELNYVFNKDDIFQGFSFEKMEAEFTHLRSQRQIGRNVGNPLEYKYGTINLTAFGYSFVSVCC